MSKKKKFLGLFAILFVAIFAMGCVFATACGKKNEEESEPEHVHEYTVLNQGDADGHYYTCPDDGDKGEVTPHTYGEWKTEKEADCGNYGTQTRTCSVCGYVDIDTTTLTPTGNHTYPTDNSAATWNWTWDEEKGYTAVTATVTCTVCNQSTTVTGTITATPDDGVYGEYEATASVGNQTYTTTKTASEFPYDPDEVAYSMSLDFSDPTTYGWMVEGLTPSQNDAGHDMYTLATSTAYTSGIVTYTTHSSGNNTINKDNDSEALYTAGSSSNFKINLAGLEGDYITITVRMSSNGSEEATATDDRILAVNTTASTSNALDSVTSNYKTDYQTLEYGQEITASDTALYLAWSGNIRIYELEINIYGEAEPDLSGDTGEGSGSGEGEIDEELFAVSAEQNVELSDTSTSASVAVSVTYDGQPYTSGEYEGYVVYIYSSDEGIASVSKEVAGGYITISTAAVSGTATVTVAVVNSSAYTTNIAYSNISVTVTGIGPDTTDMVSESITFTEAQAGDYTTDLSLFESDDLTVVAKATEDKKITIDSNNKTDPETEEKYSYRLKTNSAGTAEYGNITITTTGAAVIRFSIFSGSSGYSNIRTANFYKYVDGTNDELLYTNDGVLGDGNYVVIWTVSVSEAGTYYFASKSSSLSVYAVDILYTATVEEDENAAGYDTPAAADASVGPIGEWAGTAYFEITYTLLGTSNTDMCKADVSIVVTESTFTLETDEFVDVKGSLASLLNALTEGIYLSTSYTGSNGTYYVSYYDSDFGQINITALVGQDEKGDYLSVTFSMNVSINIGITVSATIVIDDQRVRRTDDHVHSYTGNGGYDDENHWTGTCSCGGKTGIVEHTYEWSGSTATCTQAGTETGTCSCGATTTREAAATGHTYPEATSSEITWDWANRNGDTMTVTVSFTCTACNGTVTTTSTYRYENGCLVAVAKFNGNESVEYEGSYELSNVGTALDLAEALENGVSEITLKGDVTLEEGETLSITSDVTINLGNYTITSSADSSENVITVSEGANVVITDGTIVNSYVGVSSGDNSAAIYVENGYVTLDGVTITSSSVGVRAVNGSVDITDTKITSDYWAIWESEGKVTVTINGDSEITGKAKTIYVAGDSNGYAETGFEEDSQTILIVNGGTIKSESESAISTYGLASMESAVVIINGGTIIGANVVDAEGYGTPFPAVYIPNGYLIVTGGEISGSTAVEIRGGTAYITGGIFNSIATADVTGKESNNAKTYGYALAVYPYSTTKRDSDEKFNNDVAVYVSGGEFNAALYMYNFSEVDKFEISGGKFTSDPTNYIADGYTVSTPDEDLTG